MPPPKQAPSNDKKSPAGKKTTDGPMGVSWYIWAGAAAVGLYLFFRSRSSQQPGASLVGAQAGGLTPVVGEPPSIATQGTTLQDWATAAQQCANANGVDPVLAEQSIADMIAGGAPTWNTPTQQGPPGQLSQAEKKALSIMFGCAGPPPANFQLSFAPIPQPPSTGGGGDKDSHNLTAAQLQGIHILGNETIRSLQTPGTGDNAVGVNFLNGNQANKLAGLPYFDPSGHLVVPPGTSPGMMI